MAELDPKTLADEFQKLAGDLIAEVLRLPFHPTPLLTAANNLNTAVPRVHKALSISASPTPAVGDGAVAGLEPVAVRWRQVDWGDDEWALSLNLTHTPGFIVEDLVPISVAVSLQAERDAAYNEGYSARDAVVDAVRARADALQARVDELTQRAKDAMDALTNLREGSMDLDNEPPLYVRGFEAAWTAILPHVRSLLSSVPSHD